MAGLIPWRRDRDADVGFGPLVRLRSEMDRMFDRFFDEPLGAAGAAMAAGAWMPALDVKDKGNELVVCAELPGMNPEQIDIDVSGDALTISGERREERGDERGGFHWTERRYGSFSRTIGLPPGADPDRISADYRNGELVIHIPKSEQAQSRRIPVGGQGRPGALAGREAAGQGPQAQETQARQAPSGSAQPAAGGTARR